MIPGDVPSTYLVSPPTMYLSDLRTLETMTAQFNPEQFEEVLKVVWARLPGPGSSHEKLQYDHTENHKFTFEMIYDALTGEGDVDGNLDARKFLQSLCYAKRGAVTVSDGAPPRILFVWPEMVSLTAAIGELKFKHQRFNREGKSTFFKVDVALEEIRDVRLTSEEVRESGTQRVSEIPKDAAAGLK